MTQSEPFDCEELWGFTSAQLGEFLGLAFGLHVGMRLTIDRDILGEVDIKLEEVSPGAVSGPVITDVSPGFTKKPWRSAALNWKYPRNQTGARD